MQSSSASESSSNRNSNTGTTHEPPKTDILPSHHSHDDLLQEIHDITYSPTPVTQFLHDPDLLSAVHRHVRQESTLSLGDRRTDNRAHADRTHGGAGARDTANALTVVLGEEEREAHRLRRLLREAGERLEYEMRRADDVEARACAAQALAKEEEVRVAEQSARRQAEMDAALAQEEVQRVQMLQDTAAQDLRRAEAQVLEERRQLEEERRRAAEAVNCARKAQQVLREYQALEQGREEVRQRELGRGSADSADAMAFEEGRTEGYTASREESYAAGRSEGFQAGQAAGYDQGVDAGRAEGLSEGIGQGQEEEREYALEQFDRFLESDSGRRSLQDYLAHNGTRRQTKRAHRAEVRPGSFRLYLEPVSDSSPEALSGENATADSVIERVPAQELLAASQEQSALLGRQRSRESLKQRIRNTVHGRRHSHQSVHDHQRVTEPVSSPDDAS
ncbi:hypothetical protein BKA93DRAFT_521121 [Sparassis latifolia]|uniref:Essential protein Yae1 N-terminal domain-containing protein n=1 Tax=Sparassis crispa TaxID=139825 RepID=A0A401GL10_9APHY|nr:hypothetical protein SCP_0412440 [Sparassis crispa]GBE82857.1 hypothetical protein SCP_0412440 [Sparassis crispa]